MSYIDKNSNIVISARLTDKGREKLSIGELNFNTFKLGDSEVDYTTLGSTYDISLENILKAKACQPGAKTWLLPTVNDLTGHVGIPPLTVLEIGTIIDAPEKGFFSTGNTSGMTIITTFSAQTTNTYSLNEALINVSDLNGLTIPITTGSTTSTYEPVVGDLMLIKFSNPDLTETQTPFSVDYTIPVPYLWYKIQEVGGDLATNTLQVTVDRDLPDFSSYVGSNTCDVIFYPSGDQFRTGYYSGGTVWNMNNVWSYPMAGINNSTYETYTSYGSENYVGTKEFFGYTSELSGSCETNKMIGIIHYSNVETCTSNSEITYGQKLYIETELNESPLLKVPTLMWHLSPTGTTIGQVFSGTGEEKYVQQYSQDTDIRYYDLVDQQSNVVGKIFPDQQIFVIDNEELVAALSYKSNRNWTLPQLTGGLKTSSDGLIDNTQDLHVTYLLHNSSSGFTTGIHCQTHTCVVIGEENDECPDGTYKDVEFVFPSGQFPYMTATGSTGWYADTLYLIVQKVTTGTLPDPNNWRIIDFTSDISNHTGGRIDPLNLESSIFTVTKSLYNAASTYNLHNFLNIPENGETDLLQFGDETFFYGNVEAAGITNKYRTKFNFTIPPTQWNTTNNPTWGGSGQYPHISEIIIYDDQNNVVAVGKENLPIEKTNNTTIIIEVAFDV